MSGKVTLSLRLVGGFCIFRSSYSGESMDNISVLQKERQKFKPRIPKCLHDIQHLAPIAATTLPNKDGADLPKLFRKTWHQPLLTFSQQGNVVHKPWRVGVVLSGGQAPGGHNVIIGLLDALKTLHGDSRLFGFLGGPSGILNNKTVELTPSGVEAYRNAGGFDMIGSGRTKIETPEQFQAAEKTIDALKLDAIIVVGGDDSNTNAALLAEYFAAKGKAVSVIGVPKTIDGDLRNERIRMSFGFDTACKVYSQTIGAICRDALSAKKYYHFIKVMGRSASHVALECALQTHPNMTLIGEEIAAKNMTASQIVNQVADMICRRALDGKNYGIVVVPEGLIEFVPEIKKLIRELNRLLAAESRELKALDAMGTFYEKIHYIATQLSPESVQCFMALPEDIQKQLLLDRDPHGNVQVSKIETEYLLIHGVMKELSSRKIQGSYTGSFNAQPHFLGYEGRSIFPSNFDSQYTYALGHVAALLVEARATGYICCIGNLHKDVEDWTIEGVPLTSLLHAEERHGEMKPVIKKALVDLDGPAFRAFSRSRDKWQVEDDYRYPGPMQFFGPREVTDTVPLTVLLECGALS